MPYLFFHTFFLIVILLAFHLGFIRPRQQYIHSCIVLSGRYVARAVRRALLLIPQQTRALSRAVTPSYPAHLLQAWHPLRWPILILRN